MNHSKLAPLLLIALLSTACSGGSATGGGGALPVSSPATATGTLTIGTPQTTTNAHSRRPEYVSAATKFATLWIDGATTGTRVGCNPGTGKECAINWSSTSGNHQFVVAVDDSSSITGGGNVLGDATLGVSLTVGTNTLPTVSLNGVPASYSFVSETTYPAGNSACALIAGSNCVGGFFQALDADGLTVTSPGGVDFCPQASPTTNGLIACTGTTANGQISFNAFCATVSGNTATPTNGNFSTSLATGGGTGYLTTAQLATYSLIYPSKINATTAFPSYTCANGTITPAGAANGQVIVN